MRLHGYWRSNATYRVRVALHLKDLEFEEVEHDLLSGEQFDPDFLALNPNAAVPALEVEGRVLTQSLAILDWLDSRPGGPPLWPADPFARAEAMALALNTVADAHPLIVPRIRERLARQFDAGPRAIQNWARHWLTEGAAAFEKRLEVRPPAPFLFGETPGAADIALAAHAVACQHFEADLAPCPTFRAVTDHLLALPAFADAHPLRRKEIVDP